MKKFNIIFLLNKRKALMAFTIWVVCVIMHYFTSWLLHINEPLFFIIAVLIVPIYFIIALGYTAIAFLIIERSVLAAPSN